MSVVHRGASDTTGWSKKFVNGSILFYRYFNKYIYIYIERERETSIMGNMLNLHYLHGFNHFAHDC